MSFNVNKYTQGVWLKGEDLEDGERTVVTIKAAYEHTFQDGKQQPVLEFMELDQKLTLNKTRAKKCVEILGDEPEEWIGKRIALYPVPTQFNGQTHTGVAVAQAPKGKQARMQAEVEFARPGKRTEDDDDSPF